MPASRRLSMMLQTAQVCDIGNTDAVLAGIFAFRSAGAAGAVPRDRSLKFARSALAVGVVRGRASGERAGVVERGVAPPRRHPRPTLDRRAPTDLTAANRSRRARTSCLCNFDIPVRKWSIKN